MCNRYLVAIIAILCLSGCAMSEEVRRINEVKRAQQSRDAARSTNLTGEQLFIRTCNTCHPGGKEGMGPSLEEINDKMPDDNAIKKLIRSGKGMMPAQPKEVIDDKELDLLVQYVRGMNQQ
jgi:mono/diheme cytochrome c family protein